MIANSQADDVSTDLLDNPRTLVSEHDGYGELQVARTASVWQRPLQTDSYPVHLIDPGAKG